METKIKFIAKIESDEWSHYLWSAVINGKVFEYRTGLGCIKPKSKFIVTDIPKVPTIDEVLHALFLDASVGEMSFDDFCSDLGYSNDSIKALDTYRACSKNAKLLREALGKDYQTEMERIQALEL